MWERRAPEGDIDLAQRETAGDNSFPAAASTREPPICAGAAWIVLSACHSALADTWPSISGARTVREAVFSGAASSLAFTAAMDIVQVWLVRQGRRLLGRTACRH
jgi:hypothetical protein